MLTPTEAELLRRACAAGSNGVSFGPGSGDHPDGVWAVHLRLLGLGLVRRANLNPPFFAGYGRPSLAATDAGRTYLARGKADDPR